MDTPLVRVLRALRDVFPEKVEVEEGEDELVVRIDTRKANVWVHTDVGSVYINGAEALEVRAHVYHNSTDVEVEFIGETEDERDIGTSLGEFAAADCNAVSVYDDGVDFLVGDWVTVSVRFVG